MLNLLRKLKFLPRVWASSHRFIANTKYYIAKQFSNTSSLFLKRTELLIERTTPHAPTNLTVSHSETFAVTIEWLPGYSGCAVCQQTYKIR